LSALAAATATRANAVADLSSQKLSEIIDFSVEGSDWNY
jgi:hypothetical protein